MQAVTKKRPTKAGKRVRIVFEGPASKVAKAKGMLLKLGFEEPGQSVPWRDALGLDDNQLPGLFLAGARYREGLTQAQLAEKTGIARHHISEMENSKRPIGKLNARRLAEVLKVDPRRFFAL